MQRSISSSAQTWIRIAVGEFRPAFNSQQAFWKDHLIGIAARNDTFASGSLTEEICPAVLRGAILGPERAQAPPTCLPATKRPDLAQLRELRVSHVEPNSFELGLTWLPPKCNHYTTFAPVLRPTRGLRLTEGEIEAKQIL